MPIILKNATYVDYQNFKFTKSHIKVDETSELPISFINDDDVKKYAYNSNIIDCQDKLVTKSFACGHHHAYSALARGMGGHLKIPSNFYENLKYLWWALDKSLDKDSIKASAYATAMALIKNGVTFIIDHHASPFFIKDSLEILAETFDEAGISHLLCYEISNRDGLKIAKEGLSATENYLKSHQGLVGLHASFTVEDDTLYDAVALAEKYNSGIHIHTAEDVCDQVTTTKKYGMRVVERLHKAGVLNFTKTILVHNLHLNENEKHLIKQSPVFIAQNMESNLNNNVGIFDGKGLNNNIMLGTDGMHSNMLRSLKAAYIYGQTSEKISMIDAYQRLRNTHRYLKLNNFAGDNNNNLMIFEYKSPTPITEENFLAHLIFGIEASDITHLISKGKLIMENRVLLNIDEDKVNAFTQKTAKKLWSKFKNQNV